MKRILFVDDERKVVDGLKRMLRSQRKEWEMVFAAGGQEALDASAEVPFDVIVTDMRMPGMDGAELLTRFHELHPETIRFVLSGHSELESVMRAVPVAHQFLSKPCDPDTLKEVVTRALELQNLLDDGRAKSIAGEMRALPALPETYTAVVRALADPEVELAAITETIETDVAMSAKLLQLVNSAFFGLPTGIADIGEATRYLGLETIRDLVLSIEVFESGEDETREKVLGALRTRSLWTASVAKQIFTDKARSSEAFTAGILHDIGTLVLATQLPTQFAEVVELCAATGRQQHVVEEELFGVSHAEIGAYLLGLWGLPYPILEAAAFHHKPTALPQKSPSALTAVHVASALVETRCATSSPEGSGAAQIDLAYLETLGISDELEQWEALVDAGREDGDE